MFASLRTVACAFLLGSAAAFGAGFSFTGNFAQDNVIQLFQVTMAADGVLTIQTFGYAGGLNQAGNNISAGGFAPALSVFDSTGALIAVDNLGGSVPNCNGRGIDPVTGFCFDAIVNVPLNVLAGMYTVALTQQGNTAVGNLPDGFQYDAANLNDPSFTGTNAGLPGQTFVDPFGSHLRTSAWAVDFVGDTLADVGQVPEPGALSLFLIGAVSLAAFRRKQ